MVLVVVALLFALVVFLVVVAVVDLVKIAVDVVVAVEQLLTLQQKAALTHDYRLSRAERGRP